MGVIAKHYDCLDLLNNKYEIPSKKEQPQPKEKDTFLTNPAIMEAYYELSKQKQMEEESNKQEGRNRDDREGQAQIEQLQI